MNKIILASNNINKLIEFRAIFKNHQIVSLSELGFNKDIPETGSTLEENALIKVREIFKVTNSTCISDDTGLEVESLNGAPGVFSARYAGEPCNAKENIKKLLNELKTKNVDNREAKFRTVIAFKDFDQELLFEGFVQGSISLESKGVSGFGYDPIFIPNGYQLTFAEMSINLKNGISHRANAIKKLKAHFLSKNII
jgi:XTP/dITP diphosphohydrolase